MRNVDRLLDIDEVCSKVVDFEKLLWIASKKGWEDATPRCEKSWISWSDSKYEIEEWGKSLWDPKGYWKSHWEERADEGEGWINAGIRPWKIKDWLIDQARIRHIKRKYYATYSTSSSTKWEVLKKSTTHNLLWIVLGLPVCLFCGYWLSVVVSIQLLDQTTILEFEGQLAIAGFFFGFMPWLVVLIARFLKDDWFEFELVDIQCIMLEYLDEIGMRPEGARELTREEIRRITEERRKAARVVIDLRIKLLDYLFQLSMEEYSLEQQSFIRKRISKKIREIKDVDEMDEQWISERVKRYSEDVFSNEW